MNEFNAVAKPKKGKKKFFVLTLIFVLVAAIVTGAVIIGTANKPLKLYQAARKTLFESETISITMTSKEDEGELLGDVKFGEGVDDTRVDIKLEGTEAGDGQLILIEDGEISGREFGAKTSVENIIKGYESMLPLEIDLMEYLENILNGKLDEEELGKLYDEEVLPVLEEQYSNEFGTDIELPTYYETTKIIERFLKKGVSDEAIVMEKIKSEHEGTTYEVTVDAEILAEDFVAFAKEDTDLKPLLESLVEASDGAYEDVDELAEDMINEISGGEDVVFEVAMKSGRITYIGFEDIEVVIESK